MFFQEFVSVGVSFILYVGILLRVRGNLIRRSDGWRLRFVPRSERWQLAINRDWLDSSAMCLAARMLWSVFPPIFRRTNADSSCFGATQVSGMPFSRFVRRSYFLPPSRFATAFYSFLSPSLVSSNSEAPKYPSGPLLSGIRFSIFKASPYLSFGDPCSGTELPFRPGQRDSPSCHAADDVRNRFATFVCCTA